LRGRRRDSGPDEQWSSPSFIDVCVPSCANVSAGQFCSNFGEWRLGRDRPEAKEPSMEVAQTERLLLRWLNAGDCTFILELLNEPSWIRYIGDKGVQTIQDARRYIENGPVEMYQRLGFGLYLVELKENGAPMGICGLIKREALVDVDLGFAFLPRFWANGYAFESASAVMAYGRRAFGLSRIVAVLSQDNHRSAKLLEKLGLRFDSTVSLQPGGNALLLYASAA
jgi:RimJ/RimL family protein N-acetyltransferase